jgi:PIN domain nuclease of toxin-antitoxin system
MTSLVADVKKQLRRNVSQELEELDHRLSKTILDTSAILAVIFEEKGAEKVIPFLAVGGISTVNLSEVATVAIRKGAKIDDIQKFLSKLSLEIIPFEAAQAYEAASLEPFAKSHDLSLGDRACLATGITLNRSVITADTKWGTLSLPIEIILIR